MSTIKKIISRLRDLPLYLYVVWFIKTDDIRTKIKEINDKLIAMAKF